MKGKGMRSFDVNVDLVDVPGLEPGLEAVATVYLPDELGDSAPVLVEYPGAGFTRHYFDIQTKPGYSEVEHHIARGYIVATCDFVGIGDSTPCDIYGPTLDSMAAAGHATASEVRRRLVSGVLAPEVSAVEIEKFIGVGHSMGGCLTTIQQAHHRTFDAIVVLGWSAVQMDMPNPKGGRISLGPGLPRDFDLRSLAGMARNASSDSSVHEEIVHHAMHRRDDDAELVAMLPINPATDLARAALLPIWRTTVMPACCAQMVTEHVVAPEASEIDVPILIGCGEVDCVSDPHAEPGCYWTSPDVRVVVVQDMAHMHNIAQTRSVMWDHITDFAASIPASVSSVRT
jgi:pimeloyl-ACP methyl ester carboxylesterase